MSSAVAGINYRQRAVGQFLRAVRTAEAKGWRYGVLLDEEPANRHDANAIAVVGFACLKNWFGQRKEKWKIGYVAREDAADLQDNIIKEGGKISAELYKIYVEPEGWIDIKIQLIASKGFDYKTRRGPTMTLPTDQQLE